MIPSHPLESSSPRMLDFIYLFIFLFEFPLLLSGIWLAVTTAQTLNGLQSRQVFPPSACLPVSTSKPVKLVCMCVVIMWDWDVCVSVTDRAIESTYRENLTTLLHSPKCLCPYGYTLPVLPLFLCPSCTACLSQRCTPACLKPSHSPGALSSVGGNTLNFHMTEWNVTLQMGAQLIFSSVKVLLHSNAVPALSTAQSLAGSFLRYILCVSCVHLFPGLSTSQKQACWL